MTELPTGTVTFLFTDVEGSTRVLQILGADAFRAVLDRHDEILRRAIAGGGGTVVRTEGDAFFAAFPTATGALGAAIDVQRDLQAEPWPEGTEIRVRSALHTGEGRLGGDDYVGMDVHRAARIAAAAHGGQVLISDATRALVGSSLPAGTTIRDLGTHRFKDIEQPEHLHDLIIDGLPSDFPPVRGIDATPTNLPPERTSFVGRDDEIDAITERLGETRLLSLTGPGGTGKTRLSLAVGARSVDRFRDGVFLVPLASVVDAQLVPSAIAAVLGLREDPTRSMLDAVADHLRAKEMLLLLDNFEQILDAASVVDELLTKDPELRVLVTSRAPLRISGEQEYHVAPLDLPDPERADDLESIRASESVRLFMDRTAAVRPGFELTGEDTTTVARIAARLDGLPLAIELAASRARTLSPAELLDRLEQRLPMLTGGPRDAPDRQRTLRAAIEWSNDLLSAEEQRLFARLSVFAGGWTLEAAEGVCGPGLELPVLDGLETLSDQSLVRVDAGVDGRTRFRMLETIREFAAEQLARSGEEEEIRRRQAQHVLETAEAAEPDLLRKDRTLLDRLEEEHDNVRAALRWSVQSGEAEVGLRVAGALWRQWEIRSHLREGRAWIEQLLALPAAAPRTAVRSRGLGALGGLAYYLGDVGAVRAPYEESLSIAREVGDELAEADAAYNMSFVHLLDGDTAGAEELLRRAAAINRKLGDAIRLAHFNAALAMITIKEGRLEETRQLLEDAQRTFIAEGEFWGIALTAGQLASLAVEEKRFADARTHMVRSLEAAETMGARAWSAISLRGIAVMEIAGGDPERGVRLAGAADRMIQQAGGAEPPPSVVRIEDPLELARAKLPEDRIAALHEEGRAMETDIALALARGAD